MSISNESDQDVIACLLSEREQAQRAEEARQNLFPGVLAIEELPDGYGYRFPADEDWTARVMAVVAAERQCCPFFTFEIAFEPHGRGLWLRFRGSKAIKSFVRDNFPLALSEAAVPR
ncbi:MAG: hypothetical protein QOF73_2106 [Thermomicrobiales bacterium]|jgi:hypothetical protein|nr:hypothetical protein [Thermomicrobiales bacterium]